MKEYKDERYRQMLLKHDYIYKAVDKMEGKDFTEAHNILKEAKEKYNIDITPTEVQQAIDKKKDDVWIYTMTSGTKNIRENPEFKQKFGGAREKFMPSKSKSYGTKPLWTSTSKAIEETQQTQPEIFLEE